MRGELLLVELIANITTLELMIILTKAKIGKIIFKYLINLEILIFLETQIILKLLNLIMGKTRESRNIKS